MPKSTEGEKKQTQIRHNFAERIVKTDKQIDAKRIVRENDSKKKEGS